MSALAAEHRADLARLDVLAHREILRLRAAYQLTLDELRGVYVSDEQVDTMVRRMQPTEGEPQIEALTHEADAMLARIGDDAPLSRIARQLGLDPFERDALLVALAPELDLKYETLFAYLNNNVVRRHATVDLTLRLVGRGGRAEREKLHLSSTLFREGLLEIVDPPSERRSELGLAFALAPALSAALQGIAPFDARLAAWVEELDVGTHALPWPESHAIVGRAIDASRRDAHAPLIVLEAEPAQAPSSAAAHAFGLLGRGGLRVDTRAFPIERPVLTALSLVARLRNVGLYLELDDGASEAVRTALPRHLGAFARASIPVVLAIPPRTPWRALVRDLPTQRVKLDVPDAAQRHALWTCAAEARALADPLLPLSEVAEHFRLGPVQIAEAVRALKAQVPFADAHSARESAFSAARDQSSADLGQLATRVRQRHDWSQLVLPPVVSRRLHELTDAVRARSRVFGEWGFGDRGGSGLMALFAGVSGTGKTMSAAVIARDIGLELYRIDLASVVSKYIGETEKNLQRIFGAAQSANAILFFDEADALLGKRSEVKDAHDRYANIEVAYLLQKMEEHDGVVILASNLAKNMDQAFARRMHFVVEFPRPDVALREELWRKIFPPGVPLGADVDFRFLARQFDLTGGDLRTLALDASFVAASRDRPVCMADLLSAVSRQLLKQGRPVGSTIQSTTARNAGT